jgi:bacillolysin
MSKIYYQILRNAFIVLFIFFASAQGVQSQIIIDTTHQTHNLIRNGHNFILKRRPSNHTHATARLDLKKSMNVEKEYLMEVSSLIGIKNVNKALVLVERNLEKNGASHLRYKQNFNGVEVFGALLISHFDKNGKGNMINGNHIEIPDNFDTNPKISKSKAIDYALENVSLVSNGKKNGKLVLNTEPKSEMVILCNEFTQNLPLLVYKINIHSVFEEWLCFVDATSGKVIDQFNTNCSLDGPTTANGIDLKGNLQSLNTYLVGNMYYLINASKPMFTFTGSGFPNTTSGLLITYDLNNTSPTGLSSTTTSYITSLQNTWSDKKAVSAHNHINQTYDYYYNAHGRNSLDNKGCSIRCFVNVSNSAGSSLENAFYSSSYNAVYFGNGGNSFKPFSGSLDVVGHELTHGVIRFTADLTYRGESGAINESFADIFGTLVDSTNWKCGEDIVVLTAFPSGCLRDLSDPHNGGTSISNRGYQPRTMAEKITRDYSYDNGGVHINSGIPNWAFYKLATAIGKYPAAKIYYRALTTYLTPTTTFLDLRLAIEQSAIDLYGTNSVQLVQAGLAFDAVGITLNLLDVSTEPLSPNLGNEYIIANYTPQSNKQGLFRTSVNGTNLQTVSTVNSNFRPSVADNGYISFFVGTDAKAYYSFIGMSTLSGALFADSRAIWKNIALRKNYTSSINNIVNVRTKESKDSLWIYRSLSSSVPTVISIRHLITLAGNNVGSLCNVGSMEWDYKGEYLYFDALYTVAGTSTNFSNINRIKLYDIYSNSVISNASIQPILVGTTSGINYFNPSFSKTSSEIITFDTYDNLNLKFSVWIYNMQTRNMSKVVDNNGFGFPNFNSRDRVIAYTRFDSNYNSNCIYRQNLLADKINISGTPSFFLAYAERAMYFSGSYRTLPPTVNAYISINNPSSKVFNYSCGNNTFTLTGYAYGMSGTNGLKYKWNNQSTSQVLTASLPGVYALTVSGLYGNSFATATILGAQTTAIVTQPTDQGFCTNLPTTKLFSVSATGTSLTYRWNSGQTASTIITSIPGNYLVTVAGTCGNVISNTARLLQYSSPTIIRQPETQTICGTSLATISVLATGTSLVYNWNNGNQTSSFTTSSSGVYLVTVSGTCGYIKSQEALVSQPSNCILTKVLTVENSISINIYPNPNEGEFFIESPLDLNVEVFNITGKKVLDFNLNGSKYRVTGLSKGLYVLKMNSSNLFTIQKIIVQ